MKNDYTDKNKPKFNDGDWIIDDDESVFRVTIDNNKYQLETLEGKLIRSSYKNIEKKFWLWTIQDAKNGDILEFVDHEKVVVGIVSFVNKKTGKVDVSCLLEDNKFKIGNFYALDTINPHPATKEQRDLLFQKMKEVGYEWDAEKKELKKIEQKSAWSEEDEAKMKSILFHIEDVENKDVINWFKSLKERVLPQPKQEWSEEDKTYLDHIITAIKSYYTDDKGKENPWREELLRWLESLKERYTWKPSDRQMQQLGWIAEQNEHNLIGKELMTLYKDLKKLRKE